MVTQDFSDERAELEAVLAAGVFARSPGLAQFLQYVCQRYFEGRADQIKEYNVAVEALGRPADFDQKRDSIVRVEAHRLRKRLQEYYRTEGATHKVQITIPAGNYVPHFRRPGEDGALTTTDHDLPPTGPIEVRTPAVITSPIPVVLPPEKPARAFGSWAVLGSIAAIGLIGAGMVLNDRSEAPPNTVVAKQPAAELPGSLEEVRILAGSDRTKFVDRLGNTWQGDQFYSGGSAAAVAKPIVLRAPDTFLFQTRREGTFSYDIPLRSGTYELRLYFVETTFGENSPAGGGEASRLFTVQINGKDALFYFDVVADAAGGNVADIKVFKDIRPAEDGKLHINFVSVGKDSPFVNAIEVVPAPEGKMRPVRILAGESTFTDSKNQIWGADRHYSGGMFVKRHDPVPGTPDQGLYQAERYGNFTYAIPVAQDGRYTLTLKFAENWFGPNRPGGGGTDSRVFDVYCNGRTLLKNFDVFKEAKGALRPIERVFKGLEPSPQGKLMLQFVPVRNYASINAIEVVDEGR